MRTVLKDLRIEDSWKLVPMLDQSLMASDLGSQLTEITCKVRKETSGPIVFLGMDSPELPLDQVIQATHMDDKALICPSDDGGYGLLSIPIQADPETTFRGIRWSNPLTAICQIKALTDQGICVRVGRLMYDMDEPEDVRRLCERLSKSALENDETSSNYYADILTPNSGGLSQTADCVLTRDALSDFGLLQKAEE